MLLPISMGQLFSGIQRLEVMLKKANTYTDMSKIEDFYDIVYSQCKMHRRLDLMEDVQNLWTVHAFRTKYWKPLQGE